MDGPETRRRVLAVLLAGLALVVVASPMGQPVVSEPTSEPSRTVDDVRLVTLGADGPRLWPFTSRGRSFETLTLPVNAVVHGDPKRVRQLLVAGTDDGWDGSQAAVIPSSVGGTHWGAATGATRYTYVDVSGGQWVTEASQLHDGTYFGSRLHLRLYEVPGTDRPWTAIQAHRDYWDWFRLRHTVTSLAGPRHELERDLHGRPVVTDLSRERYANGGILDADGWVTVVDLTPPTDTQRTTGGAVDTSRRRRGTAISETPRSGVADARNRPSGTDDPGPALDSIDLALQERVPVLPVLGGLVALVFVLGIVTRSRSWGTIGAEVGLSRLADQRVLRTLALAVGLSALPLVVRSAALALETVIPYQPKVVAGVLYPVFAFGPPILAVSLPQGFDGYTWFGVGFLAYGTGLVFDLGSIGLHTLPVDVVLHRFVALVVLGSIAVVGYRRSGTDPPPRAMQWGVASLWIAVLAWPLFELL